MKKLCCVIYAVYLLHLLSPNIVAAQDTTVPTPSDDDEEGQALVEIDPNYSYCFRFTWMGNEYDNSTRISANATCKELMQKKRSDHVPCKQPLVITEDATPPNLEYLWINHRSQVACRRIRGQVCATYSYYFDGTLLNATFMCTKVWTENEGAETSGCFKQLINGVEAELCICESDNGEYIPCNTFKNTQINYGLV